MKDKKHTFLLFIIGIFLHIYSFPQTKGLTLQTINTAGRTQNYELNWRVERMYEMIPRMTLH